MSESYGEGGAEPSGDRDRSRREGVSRLPEELRALGRSLDRPGAAGSESMVERVLEQILAMGVPPAPLRQRGRIPVPVAEPQGPGGRLRAVRRWARVRWRALTAGLCGVLTVLVLTPPVRAAVVDWFGFGGVAVRYDPSALPSPGARVPGCGPSLTLAQAGRQAGFEPLVPGAFGTPDAVTVTREPKGRLLMSLCWREHGHTVRLDEYPASLDIAFTKTVRESPEWVSLGGDEDYGNPALWFPKPHLLSFWLVDSDGGRFTRSERTAGPTLLWMHEGEVTLRLEGVASKARAVEIAKSLN
ncbi:hypothetical protein GCM10011579_086150 [Streptomyces albiflavescens]|uniref:DUF4367 domain-containing protein n=1 Tax=Streptomyces albiflavescens TaxID=1623582 RepID=A0A917YD21_9ACTN|nr:hypothetical protein [Streptomyces albiflavescens]GGN90349.1 hypothetical protein GCM10011579_086150 [Streptomyces albiflavescens]